MKTFIKTLDIKLRKLIKVFFSIIMVSCMISNEIYASLEKFQESVRSMGFIANTSSPEIIQSQQAGYATGGSLSMRNQIQNTNLIHFELPSIKAGCGGIDVFTGAMSYMSLDRYKQLLQAIMQSTGGFLTQIAIDTLSAQMGNILGKMEEAARFMNSLNINQCQMAASIAAGVAPKTQASQNLACQARSMGGSNVVSDAFTARYKCGNEAGFAEDTKAKHSKDSGMDNVLDHEYNLVFEALKKSGITDQAMINLMMSLTGTIILKKTGSSKIAPEIKPSLMLAGSSAGESSKSLLDNFTHGGAAELYICKDTPCLNVTSEKKQLEMGLVSKINNLLDSIALKLKNSTDGDALSSFSSEDEKLISMSSVPILDLTIIDSINNSMVAKQYSEMIAIDIALRYSEEIIDTVRSRVLELEQVQFDKTSFDSFKDQLNIITDKLRAEKLLAAGKLQGLSGLIRHVNVESDRMYSGLVE
jgi:conjugative transfer pilus assembly protein TraH